MHDDPHPSADYVCALCPAAFWDELARARHFAEAHPISDPNELNVILREQGPRLSQDY